MNLPARYTRDGSGALEQQLSQTCQALGQAVQGIIPADKLQALLLAGGYGRGEGGVLTTPAGHAPYNDLEFFLLIDGPPRLNEKRYGPAIHALEQRFTPIIGIDVEFKITSLSKIEHGPPTMFYYDLVSGHQAVTGPPDILKNCTHHRDASRIPLEEAIRLLMNRCSGLLFAAERLAKTAFTQEDLDFTARNTAKAQLALGDVVLAALGQYHWSCLERHQRLLALTEPALPLDDLRAFHETGVAFKLHPAPSQSTRESLTSLHHRVSTTAWAVWTWLEEKRLARPITSPVSYATGGLNKCPGTNPLKNALLRLRTFGPSSLAIPDRFRYPRESLLNTLAILLWAPELVPAQLPFLTRQLGSPVTTLTEATAAYARLWARYN